MTVRQIEGELRTVVDVLRAAATANPGVEAFVEPAVGGRPRRSLTFAEWDRAADGVAGLLASHGVDRGSVVALVLPSSSDYMVVYAAAARLGAITSGINPRLGTGEVRSILDRTRPVVTVVDDGVDDPVGPAGVLVRRSEALAAATGPPPAAFPDLEPTDPVAVVWTSGTTGLPKGAVFDHRSLAAVAAGADPLSEPGDRRLSPLPFAHVGTMTRTWDEVANGVTTVISPTPWRAAEAVAVMAGERVTVAQGVPTQWALVMAEPTLDDADLSALRVAGTGASRMPAELVAEVRRRLGVPVVVRYTSTEASLGTGTVPGDPDRAVAATVGRPVPGVELALVDDDGTRVAGGRRGPGPAPVGGGDARLLGRPARRARGPRACASMPTATRSVLGDDGWLTTGDFGYQDAEGNLHLVGRANELYHPGRLQRLPGRGGGRPHRPSVGGPGGGGGGPRPGAGGDRGGLRGGGTRRRRRRRTPAGRVAGDGSRGSLADYKAPDRLVRVEALPLTSMLKVDKRALGARAAELVAEGTDRTDRRKVSAP